MREPEKIYQALTFLSGCFRRAPVILCLGSDRITGDCFGPLVGEALVRRHNAGAFVYGSLQAPVTALTLIETIAFIKERHPCRPVLAVDAALGNTRDIGAFRVFDGGIYPGAAAGKWLPKAGDFSLTAVVAAHSAAGLYGARLGFVASLARTAARAIASSLESTHGTQRMRHEG